MASGSTSNPAKLTLREQRGRRLGFPGLQNPLFITRPKLLSPLTKVDGWYERLPCEYQARTLEEAYSGRRTPFVLCQRYVEAVRRFKDQARAKARARAQAQAKAQAQVQAQARTQAQVQARAARTQAQAQARAARAQARAHAQTQTQDQDQAQVQVRRRRRANSPPPESTCPPSKKPKLEENDATTMIKHESIGHGPQEAGPSTQRASSSLNPPPDSEHTEQAARRSERIRIKLPASKNISNGSTRLTGTRVVAGAGSFGDTTRRVKTLQRGRSFVWVINPTQAES